MNIFFAAIQIGYAGLVMTFAVYFLGWSNADGANVTALVQIANIAVLGVAAVLTRWVKPQVCAAVFHSFIYLFNYLFIHSTYICSINCGKTVARTNFQLRMRFKSAVQPVSNSRKNFNDLYYSAIFFSSSPSPAPVFYFRIQ